MSTPKARTDAAQAVYEAAHNAWVTKDDPSSIAAAALRAAAAQITAGEVPLHVKGDVYWPWRNGRATVEEHLLAIATELEGPMADPIFSDRIALAARPLLERVAAMADCITGCTTGEIAVVSSRAAAWLRENPPGQPVAIEPRGCPTPGACSCVEPTPPAPQAGEGEA